MAGHNGYVATTSDGGRKTIRTADVERQQAAREAELHGSPELRAALHPGGLFRLRVAVNVSKCIGPYEMLAASAASVQPLLPAGSLLMMVKAERIEDTEGIRRMCYTFLPMGRTKRCVLSALSLIVPC